MSLRAPGRKDKAQFNTDQYCVQRVQKAKGHMSCRINDPCNHTINLRQLIWSSMIHATTWQFGHARIVVGVAHSEQNINEKGLKVYK